MVLPAHENPLIETFSAGSPRKSIGIGKDSSQISMLPDTTKAVDNQERLFDLQIETKLQTVHHSHEHWHWVVAGRKSIATNPKVFCVCHKSAGRIISLITSFFPLLAGDQAHEQAQVLRLYEERRTNNKDLLGLLDTKYISSKDALLLMPGCSYANKYNHNVEARLPCWLWREWINSYCIASSTSKSRDLSLLSADFSIEGLAWPGLACHMRWIHGREICTIPLG